MLKFFLILILDIMMPGPPWVPGHSFVPRLCRLHIRRRQERNWLGERLSCILKFSVLGNFQFSNLLFIQKHHFESGICLATASNIASNIVKRLTSVHQILWCKVLYNIKDIASNIASNIVSRLTSPYATSSPWTAVTCNLSTTSYTSVATAPGGTADPRASSAPSAFSWVYYSLQFPTMH
jgi:hypothetical protein